MMDLLGHFLRKTPQFRGRARLVQRWLNQPRTKDVRERVLPGGARVGCDLTVPYEAMVWLKAEEETELRILKSLLHSGQNFIDGGANIGLWSLVAAKAVGAKGGRVLALEPNPFTYGKLCAHVEGNGLGQTICTQNVACGSKNEQLPFHCQNAHNVSSIAEHIDTRTIPVMVRTLDSLASDSRINGIKLDVEGFELPAIIGAQEILHRCHPWLCVEFNTLLTGVNRLADWDVHQQLLRLGYQCWKFTEALRARSSLPLSPQTSVRGYCNLFYAPR